jgi:TolA-binding protein
VLTPEQRAANKLKLAMLLAEYDKPDDAAEYCADIIKTYPGTAAAAQAQAFLDQRGIANPTGHGE